MAVCMMQFVYRFRRTRLDGAWSGEKGKKEKGRKKRGIHTQY